MIYFIVKHGQAKQDHKYFSSYQDAKNAACEAISRGCDSVTILETSDNSMTWAEAWQDAEFTYCNQVFNMYPVCSAY